MNKLYLLFTSDGKEHIQTFNDEQDLANFLGRTIISIENSIKHNNKVYKGGRIVISSDGTRYVLYTDEEFFGRSNVYER